MPQLGTAADRHHAPLRRPEPRARTLDLRRQRPVLPRQRRGGRCGPPTRPPVLRPTSSPMAASGRFAPAPRVFREPAALRAPPRRVPGRPRPADGRDPSGSTCRSPHPHPSGYAAGSAMSSRPASEPVEPRPLPDLPQPALSPRLRDRTRAARGGEELPAGSIPGAGPAAMHARGERGWVYAVNGDDVVWTRPAPIPAASGFAAIDDVGAVPHLDEAGRAGYRQFLASRRPAPFVVAPNGTWAFSNVGEDPCRGCWPAAVPSSRIAAPMPSTATSSGRGRRPARRRNEKGGCGRARIPLLLYIRRRTGVRPPSPLEEHRHLALQLPGIAPEPIRRAEHLGGRGPRAAGLALPPPRCRSSRPACLAPHAGRCGRSPGSPNPAGRPAPADTSAISDIRSITPEMSRIACTTPRWSPGCGRSAGRSRRWRGWSGSPGP